MEAEQLNREEFSGKRKELSFLSPEEMAAAVERVNAKPTWLNAFLADARRESEVKYISLCALDYLGSLSHEKICQLKNHLSMGGPGETTDLNGRVKQIITLANKFEEALEAIWMLDRDLMPTFKIYKEGITGMSVLRKELEQLELQLEIEIEELGHCLSEQSEANKLSDCLMAKKDELERELQECRERMDSHRDEQIRVRSIFSRIHLYVLDYPCSCNGEGGQRTEGALAQSNDTLSTKKQKKRVHWALSDSLDPLVIENSREELEEFIPMNLKPSPHIRGVDKI